MSAADRIPPHSLDAERALLGSMLVDREIIAAVAPIVKPGDFYAHVHEPVFVALLGLYDTEKPTDKISVAEDLRSRGVLEKVGGISYLSSLMDTVQTAASATYYAKIVAEKAMLRRLIRVGTSIVQIGFEGEDDAGAALLEADAQLRAVTTNATTVDLGASMSELMGEAWRLLDAAYSSKLPVGLSTSLPEVDEHIGRLHAAELVVLAGAPGSGKSVCVWQIAENVARYHGYVAFFALEMGREDTIRRAIAKRARVATRRLRTAAIRDAEWGRIGEAMAELGGLRIRVFDRVPRKSARDLRRGLQSMIAAGEQPKLVVVDHANFLTDAVVADGKSTKHDRLDRMYQELLAIASEFSVTMLLVQHLNREGMQGIPTLAALRDGGNLEGHAHIVMFVHRPDPNHEPERGEMILAKNRDGKTGSIPMTFDAEHLEWRSANALGFGGVA